MTGEQRPLPLAQFATTVVGIAAVLAMAVVIAAEWGVAWAVSDDGRPASFPLGVAAVTALAAALIPLPGPAGRIAATVVLAFALLRAFDSVGSGELPVRLVALVEAGVGILAIYLIWAATVQASRSGDAVSR